MGTEYEIKQARITNKYRDMLIDHLDVLTILYRDLLYRNIDSPGLVLDNDLFNKCVSEMCVILDHLIPKLEGQGDRNVKLLKELEEYRNWKRNPMMIKNNFENREKLHNLFNLILRSYHVLGLSSY
ncbi:MAG: hypothetical protein DRN24_06260 [Thermoplasmata archaeon]|nr:MAG: hypothetical protein DRN24_06260 [Thermoplasmata archaeon]